MLPLTIIKTLYYNNILIMTKFLLNILDQLPEIVEMSLLNNSFGDEAEELLRKQLAIEQEVCILYTIIKHWVVNS